MATDHGHHGTGAHGAVNHEQTDIHLDGIAKITIGFVAFMVVVVAAMYGAFVLFAGRDAAGQREVGPMVEQRAVQRPALVDQPNQMEAGGRTPAGPQRLTNEPLNLEAYKAAPAPRLQSYGWVDRSANAVHLPIGRAMDLIVERGLPVAASPVEAVPAEGAEEGAVPAAATPDASGQTP